VYSGKPIFAEPVPSDRVLASHLTRRIAHIGACTRAARGGLSRPIDARALVHHEKVVHVLHFETSDQAMQG
jgi:hypothetical protein